MIEIVAEIGVSWKTVEEAKFMILSAKKAGCNSVKFQSFSSAEVEDPNLLLQSLYSETAETAKALKKVADDLKIDLFSTPMYPEAVDFLEELGVKKYKIREKDGRCLVSPTGSASPVEASPLINRVLDTHKPVYISVQKRPLDMYYAHHPRISYLYCKPSYPAAVEDLELWRCQYGYGLSNHCPNLTVPVAAAALMLNQGKHNMMMNTKIIEVHVSNEPKTNYPDGKVSFNFDELALIVRQIRELEKMQLESP